MVGPLDSYLRVRKEVEAEKERKKEETTDNGGMRE